MNLKIAFGAAALALVLVACGGKKEEAPAPAAETAAPATAAPAATDAAPATAPADAAAVPAAPAPADAPKQ
jgi:hypothetical protein